MSNGMLIVVNAAMKPIPTLYHPLQTVDVNTKKVVKANVERSDMTAIAAASVVIENVVAIELAKSLLETFNASNFQRLQADVQRYRNEFKEY